MNKHAKSSVDKPRVIDMRDMQCDDVFFPDAEQVYALECKYGRVRGWECADPDPEGPDFDGRETEGNWYDV